MKFRFIQHPFPLVSLLLWAGWAAGLAAQSYRITHFAGSPGGGGFLDGPAPVIRPGRGF